jgi:SAM-dependent methyltransferase
MVQLAWHRIALAIVENTTKRLGVTAVIKGALGRNECGGVRWKQRPVRENVEHVRLIVDTIGRHLGDVRGDVGAELGPGDNIGASYAFLKRGARRMYAVEKFGSVAPDEWCARILQGIDEVDGRAPSTGDVLINGDFNHDLLRLQRSNFEAFEPEAPLDFVFSYDVLEHVEPEAVFRRAISVLKSGGRFVNVVDLTGHGVFYDLTRPLDFLTCPEWLWRLMFSHMETTNRVRLSALIAIAKASGFEIERAEPIRRADHAYLASIRAHLQPRYRRLADDDLSAMQTILVLRKPD